MAQYEDVNAAKERVFAIGKELVALAELKPEEVREKLDEYRIEILEISRSFSSNQLKEAVNTVLKKISILTDSLPKL